jgi:hypothetical protein
VSKFKRASSSPRLASGNMTSADFSSLTAAIADDGAACRSTPPVDEISPGKNTVLRHPTASFIACGSASSSEGPVVACRGEKWTQEDVRIIPEGDGPEIYCDAKQTRFTGLSGSPSGTPTTCRPSISSNRAKRRETQSGLIGYEAGGSRGSDPIPHKERII